MSIATPTRLNHVQALRGFAAMLVLLSHLAQIEARAVMSPWLPSTSEWGNMGVDLFFVISGFIMVFVTRSDVKSPTTYVPEFLFARVARIYPLYWIVSAALLIVWLIRPDLVFSSSANDPQWLNSLFLIPAYAYPLLEVGWTLVYEMMFYVLFAFLLLLPRHYLPWGLLGWALWVAAGYMFGWQNENALAFHFFSPLVFEFIAGAVVGLIYLNVTGSRGLALLCIALGLAGLLIWFFIGGTFEDQGPRVLRLLGPACLLVLGAAWLDRHGSSVPEAFVRLGDWSYALYLTHLLSLSAFGLIWSALGLSHWPAGIFILLSTSVALIGAALTYRFIEAPLIETAKRLRQKIFH
jgi:peptidoglycan/LPS O-acetylase OafA/YrhL